MKKHRQLTFEDRVYIEVWHWERKSLSFMASRLGVARSTISREKQRGGTGELQIGYMASISEGRRRKLVSRRGRKTKGVTHAVERNEGCCLKKRARGPRNEIKNCLTS